MLNYEVAYIATNLIYVLSVNKLLEGFFNYEKQNKLCKNVILILFFIVISIVIFITRIPIIIFSINICFVFGLTLCYDTSFQKKLIYSSLICSLILALEVALSMIIGFTNLTAMNNSDFNSIGGLLIIRVVLLIVSYLIGRYTISRKKDFIIPKIYYIMFSIVLTGTLYLFISSLESYYITITDIFINGFILLAVNITMIVIDEKIYNSLLLSNEKIILEQQNTAYENQMDIITQSTETMRLLKHDFKNHLLMLNNMNETNQNDEAKMYINQIITDMDQGAFCTSGNFVIDSILNFKLRALNNQGVNLSISVNVQQTVNILAYDLTAILSNLLDNAITATMKSKEKILEIGISTKFDNLIILIDNSFDGKIIEENGELKTTKPFNASHGLGLISVKKNLEKYDGDLKISYTTDMFSVSVIIPY